MAFEEIVDGIAVLFAGTFLISNALGIMLAF